MITFEFSVAAALYLSLVTAGFFVYWVYFERPGKSDDNTMMDRYVWQCPICTYYYIDSRHSVISVCPRCGSYNKKQDTISQKEGKA